MGYIILAILVLAIVIIIWQNNKHRNGSKIGPYPDNKYWDSDFGQSEIIEHNKAMRERNFESVRF